MNVLLRVDFWVMVATLLGGLAALLAILKDLRLGVFRRPDLERAAEQSLKERGLGGFLGGAAGAAAGGLIAGGAVANEKDTVSDARLDNANDKAGGETDLDGDNDGFNFGELLDAISNVLRR
jgi:hypothetical protein